MKDPGPRAPRWAVFDTNVLESRYIAPLLRGEAIRDFQILQGGKYPLTPAVAFKSVLEVVQHAKLGEPHFPWMRESLGYPGGVAQGERILSEVPALATRENVFYWFGLCEEWVGVEWAEEAGLARKYVKAPELAHLDAESRVRKAFLEWKLALQGFCDRIWEVTQTELTVLPRTDPTLADQLMRDLSRESLVPNEDLEIVVEAIGAEADVFVTEDRALLKQTALSISFNQRAPAFVHPDQLRDIVDVEEVPRWSYAQVSARRRDV